MPVDRLQELQERKNELVAQIRALADRQEEWNDEDRAKWDEVNTEYDATVAEMDQIRERQQVQARAEQLSQAEEERQFERRTEIGEARANRNGSVTDEHRALALQAWMRYQNGFDLEARHEEAVALCGVNHQRQQLDCNRALTLAPNGYQIWNRNGNPMFEQRAMSTTDSAGGYTIPEGFSNALEVAMLAFGGPRQVCRILTTATGNDLPWPTMTDTANEGELLAEEGSIGSSVDPTFGVVTFNAYKYSSKPILVSAELLQDSAFNMGQIIGNALGTRIGRITSQHFTTGTGSSQPNGLTVAAGSGVTAAGAAAITADELIDLQHSLDPAYRGFPSCGWMFADSTLKIIRKLKDGDSQYLWQPGLRAAEPDMLLGKPYTVNQDMPAATTGNVSVLFGAFEKYVIRDVAQLRLYRLEERYRDNDQTGFIAFSRHDGDLLDAGTDPIKKLTQA